MGLLYDYQECQSFLLFIGTPISSSRLTIKLNIARVIIANSKLFAIRKCLIKEYIIIDC
jgi:hypothetical protein